MAIPRIPAYEGPAFLSYGFRPFFFLGALYSALAMFAWLPMLHGGAGLSAWLVPVGWAPVDWHIHEMLFGVLPAIITGFLFTAVPNWTGRMPLAGAPLAVMVLMWLLGRVTMLAGGHLQPWLVAALDGIFLLAVTGVIAKEIIAGRNWRNLKVLIPLGVITLANLAFHAEVAVSGISDITRRLGAGAIVMLIVIIGGRIIPSFTRNWLARENPGPLPAPFDRLDKVVILASAATLLAWALWPHALLTGGLALLVGVLHLWRLGRWRGWRCGREPLVLVLHTAYVFVPVGFLLLAAAAFAPSGIVQAAPQHAFGAGAMGAMTLAVMVRASLGHTGRPLHATPAMTAVFVSVHLAALVRLAAVVLPSGQMLLLGLSALFWIMAYAGYAVLFARPLIQPRLGPRAGEVHGRA